MAALKDIGRIGALLGASPLSKSALWHQPVEEIQPAQLVAFVWRFSELGMKDLAESSIHVAQSEIQQAVARNEIGIPPLLSYSRPIGATLTMDDVRAGLDHLGQPHASAVLFALENKLDAIGVAMLTHRKLNLMGELSAISKAALEVCPRHLQTPYVFYADREGRPLPLFGLDAAVFDAFGLVWAELAYAYSNLMR